MHKRKGIIEIVANFGYSLTSENFSKFFDLFDLLQIPGTSSKVTTKPFFLFFLPKIRFIHSFRQ